MASVRSGAVAALALMVGCELIGEVSGYHQAAVGGGGASMGTGGGASGGQSAEGGSGGIPGGGAGGCPGSQEDCLNGLDDDCDDDVDCSDDDCRQNQCVPLPDGGTLVQLGTSCDEPLTLLELVDCTACAGCTVDDVGTCTKYVELYDNEECDGTPEYAETIPPSGCEDGPDVDGDSGDKVGAKALPIGVGDGQCTPGTDVVTVTAVELCVLPQPGACSAAGSVCAPPGVDCVMFEGDAVCADPFTAKFVLFDSSAAECTCDCEVEQVCPTQSGGGNDLHAYASDNCSDPKFDVNPNPGADPVNVCRVTDFTTVSSLTNHTQDQAATSATACVDTGTPSGAADLKTLCCMP